MCLHYGTPCKGDLSSTVKFLGYRACFNSEFLVSNNIPYECALGWDFIRQNNLSLFKDVNLGNYILVGKHGVTQIINSHRLPRQIEQV